MKLAQLLAGLDGFGFKYSLCGDKEVTVTGISDDTRKLKKGNLFVAVYGSHVDANKLIPEAFTLGASVVVCEKLYSDITGRLTQVKVENSRRALSLLAAIWYGNPADKMKIIGITGTKGKTTTACILYEIMRKSGMKVGLITSIGAKINDYEIDTGLHVTNPEPLVLQDLLSQMYQKGMKYVITEVTSHGLDQERVAGINFDIGILTNVAREHLDYHKTLENYQRVKIRLFENSKISILNADDPSYQNILKYLGKKKVISYSLKKQSDYKAENIKLNGLTEFRIIKGNVKREFNSSLEGEFNLYNIMAALVGARVVGVSWSILSKSLVAIKSPEGRLERVANSRDLNLHIDFAHTPESLENVLKLLRRTTNGRLIVIYGCAGERDKTKRMVMGSISAKYADISVLTAEDPRSERVNDIIRSIEMGARKAGAKEVKSTRFRDLVHGDSNLYLKIPERGKAISFVINNLAHKKDTVVICGKGHEKSMAYNGIEYPWSDMKAVKLALKGKVLEIKRK